MTFMISQKEATILRSIQDKIHAQANAVGWHKMPREFGTLIALVHSELSEALEGARRNLNDKHLKKRKAVEVELADAIIRILDIAGHENLDVAGALVEKHEYNATRPDHQLANRQKKHGKKF
jgi:NTP pyrophosphatase (non-canonical NTP hydrolase)